MNFICFYVLSGRAGPAAGGYLYRQEGSALSLAHTSSQPYISPGVNFPTEYSIQTDSNIKSNPNISAELGLKGFIQSSWPAAAHDPQFMPGPVMLPVYPGVPGNALVLSIWGP